MPRVQDPDHAPVSDIPARRRCSVRGCQSRHCYRTFNDQRVYSSYCKHHTCLCRDPDTGHFCRISTKWDAGYCSVHGKCAVARCGRTPELPRLISGLSPSVLPHPDRQFLCDQHAGIPPSAASAVGFFASDAPRDGEGVSLHHARSAEDVSGRQHARRDVEADARRAREARAAVVGFLELRAVEAREARESRDRGLEEARRAASQAEAAPTAVEDRRAVEAQDQDRELRRTIRELEAAEALLAGVRFGERESREQEREAYRAIGRAEEAPLIRFGADPPRWRENVGLSSSQRSEHPRPRSFADLRSDRALPGDTRRPPGDDWQFVEDVSIPPPEPLDQLAGFRGLAVSDSYRSMGRSEADLTRVRRVPDVATARTQATPPPSQFLRPSSEPRPLLPEPQFFSGPISDSWTWMEKIDQMNQVIHVNHSGKPRSYRPRIAILDTGCDTGAQCIMTLPDGERRLNGRWADWVGGSQDPVDEDDGQHGTALAALALRVAAHADIFIGRIARGTADLNGSTRNIVEAIYYAANTWQVDIISMSFGFPGSVPDIHNAMGEVVSSRRREGRDILFFAAANNDGLNTREAFPASDANVISVRGTDYLGAFNQAYNPQPWPSRAAGLRLGTLATDVPFDCSAREACKSGCSIATPILASIASSIIFDADRLTGDDDDGHFLRSKLRTRDGMLHVLGRMASHASDQSLQKYVAPWTFFRKKDQSRLALVRSAIDDLEPLHDASRPGG